MILGLFDFEGITTASSWVHAGLPFRLEGGENDEGRELDQDLAHLQDVYNEYHQGSGKDWLEASEKGFFSRRFGFTPNHEVKFWATPCMERWVDERLAFFAEHPGLSKKFRMPQNTLKQEI